MIEIVGFRLSFDPDVHNNRCLRPLLFDFAKTGHFLSILAHIP